MGEAAEAEIETTLGKGSGRSQANNKPHFPVHNYNIWLGCAGGIRYMHSASEAEVKKKDSEKSLANDTPLFAALLATNQITMRK